MAFLLLLLIGVDGSTNPNTRPLVPLLMIHSSVIVARVDNNLLLGGERWNDVVV